MHCQISGHACQHPVVTKDGIVYEKDLILKHIANTRKCPITGNSLAEDELIEVKTTNAFVQPRPPTINSVPSLLVSLQNEFDATMLEMFTLKSEFHKLKVELSTSLYQNDAAKRVIARLIKERDEARQMLLDLGRKGGVQPPQVNPDGTDVEMREANEEAPASLSQDLIVKIDAKYQE